MFHGHNNTKKRSRGRCKNSSSKAQQKETKTCLRKSSFSLTHFDDDGHGLLRWFMVVRLEGIFTCSAGHLSPHMPQLNFHIYKKSAFAADDNNLNIFLLKRSSRSASIYRQFLAQSWIRKCVLTFSALVARALDGIVELSSAGNKRKNNISEAINNR